jgi:DNA-binding response OmpR family regulator
MLQHILIIEDEPDIAESLRYNFERERYKVSVAESGEKGLRLSLDEHTSADVCGANRQRAKRRLLC